MAGAWNSDYFDKTETPAPPATVQQETPPPMYNVSTAGPSRGTTLLTIIFRLLTFIFVLVALGILVSTKAHYTYTDSDSNDYLVTIRFTVLTAFKYLLAACVIVAIYSLVQMIHSLITLCLSKSCASNIILASITFICDQALAYCLIAAGAASADSQLINSSGDNITGMKSLVYTCSDLGISSFCSKAAASIGLTFAGFLFLAITCVFSARRLFKLF